MDEVFSEDQAGTTGPTDEQLLQTGLQEPKQGQETTLTDTSTAQVGQPGEAVEENGEHNNQRSFGRAEVSDDDRFKFINPQRAQTIIDQKVLGPTAQRYLFKDVKPHDMSYNAERQRAYGWARYRTGATKSGAEVVLKQFDYTTFVINEPTNRAGEPYEHKDGVEVTVSYDQPNGNGRRSLTYYVPDQYRHGQQGNHIEAVSVPENINIMAAGSEGPLTLMQWDPQRGGRDPRFDAALREMGTLLSEQITWNTEIPEAA